MQTVWGQTESYQFSIDYQYRTAQRPRQAYIGQRNQLGLLRTAQNGSERVHSGLRIATNIVTVDTIFIVIFL